VYYSVCLISFACKPNAYGFYINDVLYIKTLSKINPGDKITMDTSFEF